MRVQKIPFRLLLQACAMAGAMLIPALAQAATPGATQITLLIGELFDLANGTVFKVAVLMLVIASIRLIITSDEGSMDKAKKAINAVVAGLIFITLSGPLEQILFQMNGIDAARAELLNSEAVGLGKWLSSMAAMGGIAIIVIGAFRAIGSFGDENSYAVVRTTIFHVILGMLVISLGYAIKIAFFNNSPNLLVNLILGRVALVLGMMTLIAMCIVIYAGIRMVTNFGNEDAFTGARSLIIRAMTGLLLIGISFVLTEIVVTTL